MSLTSHLLRAIRAVKEAAEAIYALDQLLKQGSATIGREPTELMSESASGTCLLVFMGCLVILRLHKLVQWLRQRSQ